MGCIPSLYTLIITSTLGPRHMTGQMSGLYKDLHLLLFQTAEDVEDSNNKVEVKAEEGSPTKIEAPSQEQKQKGLKNVKLND